MKRKLAFALAGLFAALALTLASGGAAKTQVHSAFPGAESASVAAVPFALPAGRVNVAYQYNFAQPQRFVSGAFPPGLTLAASGTSLAGTPREEGNFFFALAASNGVAQTPPPSGSAQSALANYSVCINPATLAITTASLPSATVGKPYSATIAVAGGTPPFTWAITSGALPAGLALGKSTGAISGIPQKPVASQGFTVTVTDSSTVRCGSPTIGATNAQSSTLRAN
jgi:large repetitive protein